MSQVKKESKKFGLIVDSTCTINDQMLKKEDIIKVPLTIYFDSDAHLDGTVTVDMLIDAFNKDVDIKTSQPTPDAFLQAMNDQLKTYDHVVVLALAKNLSGTYNSAILAKDLCENPEKITVIDTESTGAGVLYMVEKITELRANGGTHEEATALAEDIKKRNVFYITVDNLKYLIKGGRISRTKAVIGNVLKKKPVLKFKEGSLGLDATVRSFVGVKKYIVEQASKILEAGKSKVVVYINYVDDELRATAMKEALAELGEKVYIKIVGLVSPVVSAHVGLGTLGICIVEE
ncbi:MAG: DegV family protein [Acholeplasmataceae bacterium]